MLYDELREEFSEPYIFKYYYDRYIKCLYNGIYICDMRIVCNNVWIIEHFSNIQYISYPLDSPDCFNLLFLKIRELTDHCDKYLRNINS